MRYHLAFDKAKHAIAAHVWEVSRPDGTTSHVPFYVLEDPELDRFERYGLSTWRGGVPEIL